MTYNENHKLLHDPATTRDSARAGVQRQETLQKVDVLQSAILGSADFPLIATDEKGSIVFFNAGAERLLGYLAADLVNRHTPTHFSDPLEVMARAVVLGRESGTTLAPGFEALVFNAARGIEDIYELTCIRKDGSRFPALVHATALRDAQGGVIGYLLVATDHSARKRQEEELRLGERRKMDAELANSISVAERINLAKSDFLLGMSHQLRTPLNAILGFAQLMASESPPPNPAQKENIAQILQAGWYLMELNNEILDLATIESGRLSWSLDPMLLSEVLLECRGVTEPLAQKRGIRMTFPGFDAPCFIKADRTRVKQILVHLLSNAIQYNQVGGSVVVECQASGTQHLRVSVRDSGFGLAPEKLAQLFQPFDGPGQEPGTEEVKGVGLVLCKRLVELMGGAIGVESTPGNGSVFWVDLVVAKAPQPEVDLGGLFVPTQPPSSAEMAPRTLLYIEDNPANLQLVAQIIARRPDLRLSCAKTAVLGIEQALAERPDVILMDINLPGMSGIEAMHILQANATSAHIPIVALSANAIPRDIEHGLEAGFFRYLTKPIKVSEFLETVDEALALTHMFAKMDPDAIR